MQIYREAQQNDPAIAAAKAHWDADAGEAAAGARRPAAERVASRPPRTTTTTTRRSRAIRRSTSTGTSASRARTISASQPLYRKQNSVAFDQAKVLVAQADYVLAVAQQDLILRVARRLLRRAARAVQHRAHREPEGRGVRAARAGEAQLRGRRRDDHRHQRGAGQVRLDRRAGDHDAQRVRQPGHRAARDHRPLPEGPEEGRRRASSRSCPSPTRSTSGSTRRSRRTSTCGSRSQLRHRDARGRPREGGQLSDARPGRRATTARVRTASRDGRLQQLFALRPDRRAARRADLQGGFIDSKVREAIALQDTVAAGPRGGAAHRAVPGADRIRRRQQRGGVGQGVRAGGGLGAGRAASRTSSARKSACARTSTC